MSAKQKSDETVEVFFSYSRKDEKLKEKLETHLVALQHQRIITGWHDRMITPGEEWKGKIDDHLSTARIILLLVSADFLASHYCYDIEAQRFAPHPMASHDPTARPSNISQELSDWSYL